MLQEQIAKLESAIAESKIKIQLMNDFKTMSKTKEYKNVFVNGIFEKYAQELVLLLSNPNLQTKEEQENILTEIKMVGRLQQFLSSIEERGEIAENDIKSYEEEITFLRTNEDGGIEK